MVYINNINVKYTSIYNKRVLRAHISDFLIDTQTNPSNAKLSGAFLIQKDTLEVTILSVLSVDHKVFWMKWTTKCLKMEKL